MFSELYKYNTYVGALSLSLNFISILIPWLTTYGYTPEIRVGNSITPATDCNGAIFLYQINSCVKYLGTMPDIVAQGYCIHWSTGNIANAFNYIKDASNVGMAFTILSLFVNLISMYTLYLRKINMLNKVLGDQPQYKAKLTLIITNIIVIVFNLIAFSTFAGIINSKFDLNTDGTRMGFAGTQQRSWTYSGGFALSIIVFLSSTYTVITEYVANDDTDTVANVKNPMVHGSV